MVDGCLMMSALSIFPWLFLKSSIFSFHTSAEAIKAMSWAFAAAALGQVVIVPLLGKWADRVGHKPCFLGSLGANVVAQILWIGALMEHQLSWLLIARFLTGGATVMVCVINDQIQETGA